MGGFLAFLNPVRDLFFRERQPETAYEALKPHLENRRLSMEEKRAVFELAGLILRDLKKYAEAVKLYRAIEDSYQAGYCEMLRGNLIGAREQWTIASQQRQNHWCITLYGMVTHQLMSFPTTFQVRNHLETDVTSLIRSMQFDLLENILAYADLLAQVNPETYKFLGRSLMHSGWVDRAGPFLLRGQKNLPNDPEIYFHLGQYSELKGLHNDARVLLHQCLLITPTYNPAKDILSRLPA